MKKILVLSDTHLYNDIFDHFNFNDFDYLIHCGDSSMDPNDELIKKFLTVNGNHDQDTFPRLIVKKIEDMNVLITHGNDFNIYYGEEEILEYMEMNNLDVCFHGHTHVPNFIHKNNKYIINPGSTMMNRGEIGFGTYAIVIIDGKNLSITYYSSETFEAVPLKDIIKNAAILEEYKELLK
ncbi:MAG: YfcE family phosphodiesterase [Thomasclavelia sp.]|jgi:putative phosphoesterase|nr:YfcE family phosphodiesterase [Thomasclavelia sp.]